MATGGSQFLLILTSRDVQTATQLAALANRGQEETLRDLQRLVDEGFIVATEGGDVTAYRLTSKGSRPDDVGQHRRVLVVENDVVLRDIVVKVLEHEGYAVLAVTKPVEAVALLQYVTFDLVMTDGFSGTPGAVLVNSTDVLRAAGATPVALFTAHKLDLDAVQAAGFRDFIAKPFQLDTLWHQVKALLAE